MNKACAKKATDLFLFKEANVFAKYGQVSCDKLVAELRTFPEGIGELRQVSFTWHWYLISSNSSHISGGMGTRPITAEGWHMEPRCCLATALAETFYSGIGFGGG